MVRSDTGLSPPCLSAEDETIVIHRTHELQLSDQTGSLGLQLQPERSNSAHATTSGGNSKQASWQKVGNWSLTSTFIVCPNCRLFFHPGQNTSKRLWEDFVISKRNTNRKAGSMNFLQTSNCTTPTNLKETIQDRHVCPGSSLAVGKHLGFGANNLACSHRAHTCMETPTHCSGEGLAPFWRRKWNRLERATLKFELTNVLLAFVNPFHSCCLCWCETIQISFRESLLAR